MPIVSKCTHPGCTTLTIGPHCIEHETRVRRLEAGRRRVHRPNVQRTRAAAK